MTPPPMLAGRSVALRHPKAEDVADWLALGRSPEIVRMHGGDPATSFPLTETEVQNSLNQLAEHPHAWAIEHDGRFLGAVRLDAVNAQDRRATLAIGLSNPAKLGMGLGREAAFVAGEWHDDVMMGVLSREFGGSR